MNLQKGDGCMRSVFNIEELGRLLRDFYELAHIRITVFDSELNELVSYPEECAPFCRIIRSSQQGRDACARCDKEACAAASKQSRAYIYRCHAGLTEAVMPLRVGNLLAGYLLFGHIYSYEGDGWKTIRQCCEPYPADPQRLYEALAECPHVSREYILSAAHILHATASYLVLERMATLQEDDIAAKLDAYLSAHFTQPCTAETLCEELGISRSRLYKIAAQLYGCGISEQIRALRIDKAKQLLAERPELSITEIASACGFSDYNYFISVFSKKVGTSPNVFRRRQQRSR